MGVGSNLRVGCKVGVMLDWESSEIEVWEETENGSSLRVVWD